MDEMDEMQRKMMMRIMKTLRLLAECSNRLVIESLLVAIDTVGALMESEVPFGEEVLRALNLLVMEQLVPMETDSSPHLE